MFKSYILNHEIYEKIVSQLLEWRLNGPIWSGNVANVAHIFSATSHSDQVAMQIFKNPPTNSASYLV